jgi:hypothetical protein
MRRVRVFAVAALAAALAAPAFADIYTWTDASGRVNISNVEPPQDVHPRRIAQTPAQKKESDAARAAAQASEVESLKARVAELESEVERTQQQESAAPPAYALATPAAPRVVVVTPPAPPPITYAAPPDVARCDPLVFGCPAFGYPVNVVVIKQPRFHRRDGFHRHDGFRRDRFDAVHPPRVVPARPMLAGRHR